VASGGGKQRVMVPVELGDEKVAAELAHLDRTYAAKIMYLCILLTRSRCAWPAGDESGGGGWGLSRRSMGCLFWSPGDRGVFRGRAAEERREAWLISPRWVARDSIDTRNSMVYFPLHIAFFPRPSKCCIEYRLVVFSRGYGVLLMEVLRPTTLSL